jgi:hypothetical protein
MSQEIKNIIDMCFSIEKYTTHANNLEMRNMMISMYSNLISLAKDESNENRYNTLQEIILQYNAIEIISKSIPLNHQIKHLQEELDAKDIEIANLQEALSFLQ